MTSATDELRRILDERGVEYQVYQLNQSDEATAWDLGMRDARYEVFARFEEFDCGTLLSFWNCTPAQAVEATLGRGRCHNMSMRLDESRFSCSECEFSCWVKDVADGKDKQPCYCPNCGREVVTE